MTAEPQRQNLIDLTIVHFLAGQMSGFIPYPNYGLCAFAVSIDAVRCAHRILVCSVSRDSPQTVRQSLHLVRPDIPG